MAIIFQLFGPHADQFTLSEIKDLIRAYPIETKERRAYVLKEYGQITGTPLTAKDYADIDA